MGPKPVSLDPLLNDQLSSMGQEAWFRFRGLGNVGLYWDIGKENGNYYLGFRGLGFRFWSLGSWDLQGFGGLEFRAFFEGCRECAGKL